MLKDANDSSVLNSILPNIEWGRGAWMQKMSILHTCVTQMMHCTPWMHKCRFLRFYTFCYTNDAFYTLKSIFSQCCFLHLEIDFSSNWPNYTLNLQLTCAQKCRFYTLKLKFINLTESWRAGHFHCVFWSFLLESAPPKITWPNCNAQHVFPFDFCHLPLNRPPKIAKNQPPGRSQPPSRISY